MNLLNTVALLEDGVGTQPALRPLPQDPIEMVLDVGAEPLRAFHAWTIAEYMEAWLWMPGAQRVSCEMDSISRTLFRIVSQTSQRSLEMIAGEYLHCQRSRLCCAWTRRSGSSASETALDVMFVDRLRAGRASSSGTRIRLRHYGFTDRENRVWQLAMWSASLNKLQTLLR